MACNRSNSSMWRWYSVLLAVAVLCEKTSAGCSPAEEGRPTTLTCSVNSVACSELFPLEWQTPGASTSSGYVAQCGQGACSGPYDDDLSATITGASSTLTISSVSRHTPFNVENSWRCFGLCDFTEHTACNKLEVYAKPENSSCTMREHLMSGYIYAVTIQCSTTRVYPRAKCSFERIENGGSPVAISQDPTYTHTPSGSSPEIYYRSECDITVQVGELGEGRHSFQAHIYPDVTGGRNLVGVTHAPGILSLRIPKASYDCSTPMLSGYFDGESANCTCSLEPGFSVNEGLAAWFHTDGTLLSSDVLHLTFDSNNPEQVYTCKGISHLREGLDLGSNLTARFAFFDTSAVDLQRSTPSVNGCDSSAVNTRLSVTCRIRTRKIHPAPAIALSLAGQEPQEPQVVDAANGFYQREYSLTATEGGEYRFSCSVSHAVLSLTVRAATSIVYRDPPPHPPQITIDGKSFRGTDSTQLVTLADGYTGDATCHVLGGYPSATSTNLRCGSRTASGPGNVTVLDFQTNPVSKDLDESVCVCTGQHESGCYDAKTTLTLDVTYAPVVNFTLEKAAVPVFNEGATPTLICWVRGNPAPSVSLVREETGEQLATEQQGHLKAATLNHTLTPLSCLDSGTYVCTGQNSQGVRSKKMTIEVTCAPVDLPSGGGNGSDLNLTTIIIIGVAAGVVVVVLVVINVTVVRRMSKIKGSLTQAASPQDSVTTGEDVVTESEYMQTLDSSAGSIMIFSPRDSESLNHYETISDVFSSDEMYDTPSQNLAQTHVYQTTLPVGTTTAGSTGPATSNTALKATSNTAYTAANNTVLTATSNTAYTAANNTALTATSNTAYTAANNTALTATSNTALTATSNTAYTAANNTALTATSNTALTATSNTAYTAANNTVLTATTNTALTAANNTALTATSNTALTAAAVYATPGDIYTSNQSDHTYLTLIPDRISTDGDSTAVKNTVASGPTIAGDIYTSDQSDHTYLKVIQTST